MLTCIDVKFIFDNVRLGLSSSANTLQVADVLRVVFLRLSSGMFLAIISPSSSFSCYSWNEWNVRHFFSATNTTKTTNQTSNQNNSTLCPGLLCNGALTCSGLHFWRHFLVKHKILPDLVISSWLWWIMRVLPGPQIFGLITQPFVINYALLRVILTA